MSESAAWEGSASAVATPATELAAVGGMGMGIALAAERDLPAERWRRYPPPPPPEESLSYTLRQWGGNSFWMRAKWRGTGRRDHSGAGRSQGRGVTC